MRRSHTLRVGPPGDSAAFAVGMRRDRRQKKKIGARREDAQREIELPEEQARGGEDVGDDDVHEGDAAARGRTDDAGAAPSVFFLRFARSDLLLRAGAPKKKVRTCQQPGTNGAGRMQVSTLREPPEQAAAPRRHGRILF